MIELNHQFVFMCHEWDTLLKDCKKLNTFCNRVAKLSVKAHSYGATYDPNKYKGDAFEAFAEFFFKAHPIDNRVGIKDYKVVPSSQDLGVDGHGTGFNLKPATVQVKFRSDSQQELISKDLNQFTGSSFIHYGVAVEDTNNMVVFTNAEGLHYFTNGQMFANKVRCLGNKELRKFVDNNEIFWELFRETITENRTTTVGV